MSRKIDCLDKLIEDDGFTTKLIRNFLSHYKYIRWSLDTVNAFILSFNYDAKIIEKLDDFNDFYIINHLKNISSKTYYVDTILDLAVNFYRFIYRENLHKINILGKRIFLNEGLLLSSNFKYLIRNKYEFINYKDDSNLDEYERVCFIINGMQTYSVKLREEDYCYFNLSNIKCLEYRSIIYRYIRNINSTYMLVNRNYIDYVTDIMKCIYDVKSDKKYPNQDLYSFNNKEGLFIKSYIQKKLENKNNQNIWIGAIRRFFQWSLDNKIFDLELYFLNYLSPVNKLPIRDPKCIPDNDLTIIEKQFRFNKDNSIRDYICFTIFHILLQTEFRIGQICRLETDSIRSSLKPNQYILKASSKVSRGEKVENIITRNTYTLLMNVIEKTEKLRDQCTANNNKRNIFLDEYNGRIISFKATHFNKKIKQICTDNNLPLYTASNLRDTHMTKSLKFISDNSLSDLDLAVLTNHKYKETTKRHYVDKELKKMLESIYMIELDDLQVEIATNKIVDDKNLVNDNKTLVQDNCGNCSNENCDNNGVLPCFLCKHFVTTIDHESFYLKSINQINEDIVASASPHDKEDLRTIKKIYVTFYSAILNKRKELHDSNNQTKYS